MARLLRKRTPYPPEPLRFQIWRELMTQLWRLSQRLGLADPIGYVAQRLDCDRWEVARALGDWNWIDIREMALLAHGMHVRMDFGLVRASQQEPADA